MIPFTLQPLSTIEPITPQRLAQGGAAFGQVPVWNGIQYAPLNPVSWLQNGVSQGRISQVNITGNATSSVVGDTATLNVAGGVNVNGSPVSGINTSTGISVAIASGIATLSATGGVQNLQNGTNTTAVPLGGGAWRIDANIPASVTSFNGNAGAINLQNGVNTTVVALGGGAFRVDAAASAGMTFFRAEQVNAGGGLLYTNNIQQNFALQFQAGNNISITPTSNVDGTRIRIDANAISYTHPSYPALTLTPTIVGNTLNLHTIVTDSIGSVANGIPIAIPLPSSATTTLAHSGTGNPIFSGSAPSYTMRGIRTLTPSTLSITDTGVSLDFSVTIPSGGGAVNQVTSANPTVLAVSPSTGNVVITPQGVTGAFTPSLSGNILTLFSQNLNAGSTQTMTATQITLPSGGGGSSVEVRKDGVTINPSAFILNFTGAGVSVANGLGVEINIPSSGGGITGISLNGAGNYTDIQFAGGGVSVFGNVVTIASGGGVLQGFSGNGLTVTADSVSLALASGANAGAMPILPMNATLFLNGLGQWTAPSVGGTGVTSFNGTTGAIQLQNGTNTTVVALGGGVFRLDAASSSLSGTTGNGLTVGPNSVSLGLASGLNAGAFKLPYSGEADSGTPIMILKNTQGGSASVLRLDHPSSAHVLEILQFLDPIASATPAAYLGILVNGTRYKIPLHT